MAKTAVKLAPSSLDFYSWMFFVQKLSGAWHPVIDLLTPNRCVLTTEFRMETTWSVLQSIQQNDWIFSIDLKDGYPRVFFHLHSHQYLRFVCHGQTFQFRFCRFGLAMAPQVFMVGFTCVGNSPSTGHPDTLVSGQLVVFVQGTWFWLYVSSLASLYTCRISVFNPFSHPSVWG